MYVTLNYLNPLITHHNDGVLLDPGGFGVIPQVLAEMLRYGGAGTN